MWDERCPTSFPRVSSVPLFEARFEILILHVEAKIKGLDSKQPWEKLCVNVGTRVKAGWSSTPGDTIMREQSLGGAQWIPACLLEIVPNQMTNAMLSPEHTAEMLRNAVRLPAANAGLIVEEGLPMIGLKTSGEKDANEKLVSLRLNRESCII